MGPRLNRQIAPIRTHGGVTRFLVIRVTELFPAAVEQRLMCVAVSGVSHGIRPQSPGPAHRTGIGIQRHQGRRSDCRLLGGIVRDCGAGRVEEKNRPAGRGEGQIRVQLICEINRPSGVGRAGSGDEVGHVAGFRQRRETGPRIPGAGRQREGQEQGSRDEAGEWRQSFHEASPARAYRW